MSSVATSENPAVGGMPDSPVPLPRGRRRTEVAMLVFAVALVAFAYANVGFGLKGKLPPGMAEYLLGFIVLLAIAHLAVRKLAPWADPLLLPLAAALNGLGIVMIYRLQEVRPERQSGPGRHHAELVGGDLADRVHGDRDRLLRRRARARP